MSFQADTRRHFELWLAELLATTNPAGFEPIACPQCGEQIVVRWGRNSERWMAYHPAGTWCNLSAAAWYGATRAEAIENFQTLSGGSDDGRGQVSPAPKGETCKLGLIDNATRANGPAAAQLSPPAGAATIAGWEVSGLSDEAVNALLQMNAEPK